MILTDWEYGFLILVWSVFVFLLLRWIRRQ